MAPKKAGFPFFLFAGVAFFALYAMVALLVHYNLTQGFDNHLAEQINSSLGSVFSELMYLASAFGREWFWIPIVALMLIFGKQDTKMIAIELAILFVLGIITGTVAKDIEFRNRPFLLLPSSITLRVPPDYDSSFPSGHAVIVSLGASFLITKYLKSTMKAKLALFFVTLEAAIVCYSRVYNGVHFPTDVLGGIFLGIGTALIGSYFLERYFSKYLQKGTSIALRIARSLNLPEAL
ncbi:MAG: phosphatase PAP2 family protein [Nitrososphaerales archaeon]